MRRDDTGFTLIELIIATALLGVIGAIAANFLINMTQVTDRSTKHVEAEREALIALRRMTQEIRAANPVLAVYPTAGGGACDAAGSYPSGYGNCLRFVISKTDSGAGLPTCTAAGNVPVFAPYTEVTYGLRAGKILMDRKTFDAACAVTETRTGATVLAGLTNTTLFEYFDTSGAAVPASTAPTNAGSVRLGVRLQYQESAPSLNLFSFAALRNNR